MAREFLEVGRKGKGDGESWLFFYLNPPPGIKPIGYSYTKRDVC
jgi:hypothetical protein